MTGKVSLIDVFGQRQLLNDAVRPAGDRADCHHLVEDCIGNDDVANPHDALLAGELEYAELALRVAREALILERGQVVFRGTPAELHRRAYDGEFTPAEPQDLRVPFA